jgi:UDP-2,3-diacylglucosamine hydrolase
MSKQQKSHNKSTYFISDLHLIPSQPQLFTLLHDFLNSIKSNAEALYILGDLFEFWIGDDIIEKSAGKPYAGVIQQLRSLSESGVKIFFTQGNRDFLAQQKFADAIGGVLLADEKVINLYGTPTLLMHGDTLCTDDLSYQRLRKIFRNKIIQKIYLSLSPDRRSRIAGNTRKIIKNKTPKKAYKIVDVNQQEVERVMKNASVQQLIHGHTHRPAIHKFDLNGVTAKRIVLSDWTDKARFLRVDDEGFELL